MVEAVQRELFVERTGETVETRAGGDGPGAGEAVPLRIDRVDDYGSGDGTRFSVFMSGPGDRLLPQGIHRVTVRGVQPFDLFVVPIGREQGRFLYEAAFNRTAV